MSSTRNTKRKRSNAGASATSSTRQRADPAQGSTGATESTEASSTAPDGLDIRSTSMVSSEAGSDKATTSEGGIDQSSQADTEKSKRQSDTNSKTTKSNGDESSENDTMDETHSAAPTLDSKANDASETCSSSQDANASTTRRQAQHVANEEDDRIQKLKDLISHRTVLLLRIRACRETAEKRIGIAPPEGETSENLEDDKEIAAFKSMTKQANQAARKLREAEGSTEKRTSLSLRRGSNIGKRMNAALSSLAPGSNVGASATAAESSGQTSAASGAPLNLSKAEKANASKQISPKSSGRMPTPQPGTTTGAVTTTASSAVKSSIVTKSYLSTKQSDATTSRGRMASTNKNSKAIKLGGSTQAGGQPPSKAPRNNPPLSTRGINPHLLASYQGPKVHFAEAIVLRERRDQIEAKLRSLLIERQDHLQHDKSKNNNPNNTGMNGTSMMMGASGRLRSVSSLDEESMRRGFIPTNITNKKGPVRPSISQNHSPINNGLEIPPPALIPRRRRTHWDTVLQEMSWLATDFIEERKWKLSTSRLIASKIPPQGFTESRRKRSMEAANGRGIDGSDQSAASNTSAMDTDRNEESSKEVHKKTKESRRNYAAPGGDDEKIAKSNGRILSSMIAELKVAIQKGGCIESPDVHHQEALHKFNFARSKILGTTNDSCSDKGDTANDQMDVDESDSKGNCVPGLDSTDDYIDHFHALSNAKHKLPAKETSRALKTGKLKLTSKQKETLEFVDKLWTGEPHVGALVEGPSVSGKTFVTATILWKQRSNGSQLLICPSTSLIRWKYELNRFSDLRVLTFGLTGGISNPDGEKSQVQDIETADIILCEYALVKRIRAALGKFGVRPYSVVVDQRHFLGLCRSSGARCDGGDSVVKVPPELKSLGWWKEILEVVGHRNTRCLFLEYSANDRNDPLCLSTARLGEKQQISILAIRAACILGPQAFQSSSEDQTTNSVQRQVLVWARKKGKSEITGDKASRVKTILRQAIDPLCIDVGKAIAPNMDYEWELRSCAMNTAQRNAYERCCREVRGALVLSLRTGTDDHKWRSQQSDYTISIISNALFRLRQQCFYDRKLALQPHSVLFGKHFSVARTSNLPSKGPGSSASMDFLVNSSQPNASSALQILQSSSKLLELASILVEEGGYSINLEPKLLDTFGIPSANVRKSKTGMRHPKKIILLAALHEIQHIVSVFLDSLGIHNEWMVSQVDQDRIKPDDSDDVWSPKVEKLNTKTRATAWVKTQNILSNFGSDESGHRNKSRIIIASPAVLSDRNGGIGVEDADIIIALDSDWSRRDEFIMDSLLRRWCAKNKLSSKDDTLLTRLVCEDTIEANIFSQDTNDKRTVSKWPLDNHGFLSLPNPGIEASKLYKQLIEEDRDTHSAFPAVMLLRCRGDLLKDTLGSSSELPSFFGSGAPNCFLPKDDNADEDRLAELKFLQHFVFKEKSGFISEKLVAQPVVSETSMYSVLAGLSSRQDTAVIASRLFLEKFLCSNSEKRKDSDDSPMDASQHQMPLLNGSKTAEESSVETIEANPSSMLFYEALSERIVSAKKATVPTLSHSKSPLRCNAYAKLFSSSWNGVNIRDGNQGCEPLVFFPPLFPFIESRSKLTARYSSPPEVTGSLGNTHPISNGECNASNKRKDAPSMVTLSNPDLKRAKAQPKTGPNINGYSSIIALDPTRTSLCLGTNSVSPDSKNGTKPNALSSGFKLQDEDFGLLGAGVFPRQTNGISFSARDAISQSVSLPSRVTADCLSYNIPCDIEEANAPASRALGGSKDSMILFVKKRPRSSHLSYKFSKGLSGTTSLPIGGRLVEEGGNKKKKKVSQGVVTMAPTAFTRLPTSAVNTQGQTLQRAPIVSSRPFKGDYRHRMLASFYARQRATGLTIFDSVSFRVAAMRVENRVRERLERLMWQSTIKMDQGPGVSLHHFERSSTLDSSTNSRNFGWSSCIEQLKEGLSTGDAALSQSKVQKVEFKRSTVSPRCVDFGLFEAGYLASPSGMTNVAKLRFRVGVSLPMGVKVMEPAKDGKLRSTWNADDDELLVHVAKKFSMNWSLISCSMSGIEKIVIQNRPNLERIVASTPRSARQCRDRWQFLSHTDPSLSQKLGRSERLFQERAPFDAMERNLNNASANNEKTAVLCVGDVRVLCRSSDFLLLEKSSDLPSTTQKPEGEKLLPSAEKKGIKVDSPRSTVDKKDDAVSSSNAATTPGDVDMTEKVSVIRKPNRRTFSAVSIAKSRRQMFPITIPGVDMGGSQAGHPVPSHPSHMQSVQMSPTAQWASGRTEMWPLQILDLADRQRNSAARVGSLQRGEMHPNAHPTTHTNHPRHHPAVNPSYQHRQHPSQQSSGPRTSVAYSPARGNPGQAVAQRSMNPSVAPRHQHRTQQVPGSNTQPYIGSQSSATSQHKPNETTATKSRSSPKKG